VLTHGWHNSCIDHTYPPRCHVAVAASGRCAEKEDTMSASQGKTPVSDLTYDLITALQNKLQALTAYEKFLKDAQGDEKCAALFRQLQEDDRKHAEMLKQELTRHLGGK